MKKYIVLLLSTLILLSGCTKTDTDTDTKTTTEYVSTDKGYSEASDREKYPYIFAEGSHPDMSKISKMTEESKATLNEQLKKVDEHMAESTKQQAIYDEQRKAREQKDEEPKELTGKAYLTQSLADEHELFQLVTPDDADTAYPTGCLSAYFHKKYGNNIRMKSKSCSVLSDTTIQYMIIMPDESIRNMNVKINSDKKTYTVISDEENSYYKMFPDKK